MQKLKHNQNGFSAVEIVLVLVSVVLIGAVGWLVYKNQHKSDTPLAAKQSTSKTSKASTKPADPYKGWQSFCSEVGGLCLKYPAGWTPKQDPKGNFSGSGELDTITSPSGAVAVSYTPVYGIGGVPVDESIDVKDVLSATAVGFVVVEAVETQKYESGNTISAQAFVTTQTQASKNGFTKGATVQINGGSNAGHAFEDPRTPNATGQQIIRVTKATKPLFAPTFSSNAEAQEWLASPEVATAIQILKSTSYK